MFVFSIWGARNHEIFQNKWFPLEITAALLLQKVEEHKTSPKMTRQRKIVSPEVDKSYPWAFFDGASQGEPLLGGAGGVLYVTIEHKFSIKYAPRRSTNNKAELTALWAVLKVAEVKMF